jgi:hypothetical protein
MQKDCRENCTHFKMHTVDERVTVCNHPSGPEIVYPRAEPWACTLWKKRSSKLPPADPNDKVHCLAARDDQKIEKCLYCQDRPDCYAFESYSEKHKPINLGAFAGLGGENEKNSNIAS